MKTAIALLAAALSVAALSTNASAQKLMPAAGMKAPKIVANVGGTAGPGGTSYMTGGGGKTSANVGGSAGPGGTSFMTGGADTSFGTRNGGGFKLASETDEANPNDSPGPKPEKIMRPTTGLLFVSFIAGSAGPGGDNVYTSAKISGNAGPGGSTFMTGGDDVYTSAKLSGSASPGGDDV